MSRGQLFEVGALNEVGVEESDPARRHRDVARGADAPFEVGPLTEEGSGLLIMSIAGGALASLQGKVADLYGLHWGFLVTAACALYVLFYALWGAKRPSTG